MARTQSYRQRSSASLSTAEFAHDLELARLERAGQAWLDARARGLDTKTLDENVENARRRFRRAERKMRKQRKKQ